MGKRRGNIITDKDDTRFFPEGSFDKGEQIDLSFNLRQASSLYMICVAGKPELRAQLRRAKKKLKDGLYETPEEMRDLTHTVEVFTEIIKDAEGVIEEIGQIINELS